MKTKVFYIALFAILFSCISSTAADRVIVNPVCERQTVRLMHLTKIDLTSTATVLYGEYISYADESWVNFSKDTYILTDGGLKLNLIKSTGIPTDPQRRSNLSKGEIISFSLHFPSIGNNVNTISLIEGNDGAFNMYNIYINESLINELAPEAIGKIMSPIDNRIFSMTYLDVENESVMNSPTLRGRLRGSSKAYISVPVGQTELDQFIFSGLEYALTLKGLMVEKQPTYYENEQFYQNGINGFTRTAKKSMYENYPDYNSITVITQYRYMATGYGNVCYVYFTVVDLCGNSWSFDIKLPRKLDTFVEDILEHIGTSNTYDSSKGFINNHYRTNWEYKHYMSYFESSLNNDYEGIYTYKGREVAILTAGSEFLCIYLLGAKNQTNWKEGYVQAILEQSSTNGIATGWWEDDDFYGDVTVAFDNGCLTVIGENMKDGTEYKQLLIKKYPQVSSTKQYESQSSSGSGFLVSTHGYVITNYHVIESATDDILITGLNGDMHTTYNARIEIIDKQNDLALLKIIDSKFVELNSLPYGFRTSTCDLGEDCYVLGYPMITTMGTDIKLTTGIISSKTGFQGDVSCYQISAPVQPGNSGGPLFDKNGNIIGIVSAKHGGAENVGYAIKCNYIANLVDLLDTPITLNKKTNLVGKTLSEQVKHTSTCTLLILVNYQ